jgi:D-threo-aldose 1-dehydrogenase
VRAIGIGVNDADVAERFVREADLDCVLLAGRYSLLEQPALDRFLPLALERGVGVMLGGVFNSGILATGAVAGARYNYRPAPPDVVARVDRHRASLRRARRRAGACGARVRARHPAVSSVVLGAVSPERVRRNVEAFAAPVPASM